MYTCQYCKKVLSCKSALCRHIKTTKSCIRLQQEEQKIKHICNSCNKTFSTKYTLRNHQIRCKGLANEPTETFKTVDIETLRVREDNNRKDIEELKRLLTTTNKAPVVQNMEPVTVAHIQAMALEHLDISDIEEGVDGIVDFTVQYPLQGRVICIDKARRKFRYTDEHGNIVNDFGGLQLSKTVFTGIQARCVQLIDQRYAELAADIKIAVDANRGYEDAVLANMITSTELQNLKQSLIDAAKGAENELQKGYIRKLVKELK